MKANEGGNAMGEILIFEQKHAGQRLRKREMCRFFRRIASVLGMDKRFYHLCAKKPYRLKPDANGVMRTWHPDGFFILVDEERAYEHCSLINGEGRCPLFKFKFPDKLVVQKSA